AARVGFGVRPRGGTFLGSELGSELTFGAAAGVCGLDCALVLGPELYGSTVVTSSEGAFKRRNTPLEVLLGAHYAHPSGWRAGLGSGVGLTRGVGTPEVRGVVSFEWVLPHEPPKPPKKPDRDRDGVADDEDVCPDVPGVTRVDDKNGCPFDADNDGVADGD